jgi:hypothetical protein
VHLDQIYRQGKDSRIVHGAHEIMNGTQFNQLSL